LENGSCANIRKIKNTRNYNKTMLNRIEGEKDKENGMKREKNDRMREEIVLDLGKKERESN